MLVSLYGRGGMAHYSSQLANALAKDNEVAFVGPTHIDRSYFIHNIEMKLITAPTNIFSSLLYLLKLSMFKDLLNFIDAFNPDIVHFLNEHPWNNILFSGIKYRTVLTCHDPNPHIGEHNKLIAPLFRLNLLYQLKLADRIIVHGNNLLIELISKNINPKKVVIIPHGDYSFFKNYIKDDCQSNDVNSILFFGRIRPYKGIEYLLKAEPFISQKVSNYKIIIAGDGDIHAYKRYIMDGSKTSFINKYLSDTEVAYLFKQASVVVLPYLEASQSGVIPISYAFKKPVVATNVGSLPEIVEDNITGFLVPPRDSYSLAKAIIKLLENPDLRNRMGENAYNKIQIDLSWNKIADQTLFLYKTMVCV